MLGVTYDTYDRCTREEDLRAQLGGLWDLAAEIGMLNQMKKVSIPGLMPAQGGSAAADYEFFRLGRPRRSNTCFRVEGEK